MEKNEERIKVGLAITTKVSAEIPTVGGKHTDIEILEEIKGITETQQQILNFLTYQYTWNKFMESKWAKAIFNLTNAPFSHNSIFGGPSGIREQKKASAGTTTRTKVEQKPQWQSFKKSTPCLEMKKVKKKTMLQPISEEETP